MVEVEVLVVRAFELLQCGELGCCFDFFGDDWYFELVCE